MLNKQKFSTYTRTPRISCSELMPPFGTTKYVEPNICCSQVCTHEHQR